VNYQLLADQIKGIQKDFMKSDEFKYSIMGNFCLDEELTELMKVILMFPEVAPIDKTTSLVNRCTCRKNLHNSVEIFLIDGRVLKEPKYHETVNFEFMRVCQAGKLELVRLILEYSFDPSGDSFWYVVLAIDEQHHEIAKLLLSYESVFTQVQKRFPNKIITIY